MQNPWNPSVEKIRQWAYDEGAPEPEIDFHLALAWARYEKTYLDLASDPSCPKRGYFLDILYLIVGDAVRSKFRSEPKPIIAGFVERGSEYTDPGVRRWQERSRQLLEDPSLFDYALWCGGGFAREEAA